MTLFLRISLIVLIFSITPLKNSFANWITKKSDKSKIEIKAEKKEKKQWIKLKKKKIQKNKAEYKKKEKNINKIIKSYITKKNKRDKWLNVNELPNSEIYFVGNSSDGKIYYGYINDDKDSELIQTAKGSFYKISKGKAFISESKTICNVGTERGVIAGRIIGFVSGECTNKVKFTGEYSQARKKGNADTEQKQTISFSFSEDSEYAPKTVKLYESKKDKVIAKKDTTLPARDFLKPNGKYYALLIGNSKYESWSPLTSPKNDVSEISRILEDKYKFDKIITVVDADRAKIFKAFNNLSKIATDKDYILIYYAGHGEIKSNQSYWIPVNAEKEFNLGGWININDIEVYVTEKISAHHLVVMVDSCYFPAFKSSNKITENKKSKAYDKMLSKRARIVLSSGFNEPVLDTGNGNHSTFALSFIQQLKNNNDVINLETVAYQIYQDHSGMRQSPNMEKMVTWGHGNGDFLFIAKK